MARRTLTLLQDTEETTDVLGLVQLGAEQFIRLTELKSGILLVGAADRCHIRVQDAYISAQQFALLRMGREWRIAGIESAKNATYLNGVRLHASTEVSLTDGATIRAGATAWVATSREERQHGEWYIAARNLDEFYTCALLVYGSGRSAAEAIGMDHRTYQRRINEIPEARAVMEEQIKARRASGQSRPRTHRPLFGIPVQAIAPDRTDAEIVMLADWQVSSGVPEEIVD